MAAPGTADQESETHWWPGVQPAGGFGLLPSAMERGCSTGAPGAVDFIQRLNQQGMASIITTSTGVTPQLAGDFLACLADVIRTHSTQTDYYLSNAYLNTLECLQVKSMMAGGAKYGSRALTYAHQGNGTLKLCVPKKRPQ